MTSVFFWFESNVEQYRSKISVFRFEFLDSTRSCR